MEPHLPTRKEMEARRRKENLAYFVSESYENRRPYKSWGKGSSSSGSHSGYGNQRPSYSSQQSTRYSEPPGLAKMPWKQTDKWQYQGDNSGGARTRSRTRDDNTWGNWKPPSEEEKWGEDTLGDPWMRGADDRQQGGRKPMTGGGNSRSQGGASWRGTSPSGWGGDKRGTGKW